MAYDYLSTPMDQDYKFKTLSEALSGDSLFGGEEPPAIDTTKLKPAEFATAEELQNQMQEEYRQKVEFYKELANYSSEYVDYSKFFTLKIPGIDEIIDGSYFGLKGCNGGSWEGAAFAMIPWD